MILRSFIQCKAIPYECSSDDRTPCAYWVFNSMCSVQTFVQCIMSAGDCIVCLFRQTFCLSKCEAVYFI